MQLLSQVTFLARKVARQRADDMVLLANVIVRPCPSRVDRFAVVVENHPQSRKQAARVTRASETLSNSLFKKKITIFRAKKLCYHRERNRSFSIGPCAFCPLRLTADIIKKHGRRLFALYDFKQPIQ
jgi:hypothetical protein